MLLTYVGPFVQGVDLPLPDGTEPHVDYGAEIEVADEYAATLLEQPSNWQPVSPAPTPQAPSVASAPTPASPPAPAPELDPAPAEVVSTEPALGDPAKPEGS